MMSDFDDAFRKANQPQAAPPPPNPDELMRQHKRAGRKTTKITLWVVLGSIIVLAVLSTLGRRISPAERESSGKATPKANGSAPRIESQPVITPPATGQWELATGRSELDDSRTETAELSALNEIEGWPRKTVRPLLILRCQENETSLIVRTGMSANVEYGNTGHATLRVRIDEGKAFENNASQSTNREAYFLASPVAVAKRIMAGKEMLVQFTPFNSSPQTIRFDIEGATEAFKPVRAACKW